MEKVRELLWAVIIPVYFYFTFIKARHLRLFLFALAWGDCQNKKKHEKRRIVIASLQPLVFLPDYKKLITREGRRSASESFLPQPNAALSATWRQHLDPSLVLGM